MQLGDCVGGPTGAFVLLSNGNVDFYSGGYCNGIPSATLSSSGSCANYGGSSYALKFTSHDYIEYNSYIDSNCATPDFPYKTYYPIGVCESTFGIGTLYYFVNGTVIAYSFLNSQCTGNITQTIYLPAGCNLFAQSFIFVNYTYFSASNVLLPSLLPLLLLLSFLF